MVFTINGDYQLPEHTLDHWEGYRGSSPVRIGNDAVSQFQGDIYGELMDAFYLSNNYVWRNSGSCSGFGFVLWLRGVSIRENFASRDPVAATVARR